MSEPRTDTNADHRASEQTDASVSELLATEGARFTRAREAKGWSLGDVSSRLKVSANKLRALEAGDVTRLPDTVFALGVVRSYAKMLGIDATPFAQLLRRARGEAQPDLSMPAPAGTHLPRASRSSPSFDGSGGARRTSWLWYIGAVIIAMIGLGIWRANWHDASPVLTRLQAAAASGASAASQPAGASGASVAQTVAPASVASAASMVAAAGKPADASGTAPASAATPAVHASAVMAAAASAVQQPAAPAPATSAPDAAAGRTAGTATMVVHTTQDTWIGVRQKDGKVVFSGIVHSGSVQQASGVAPLKVTVGNALGIGSMTLNDQPVDASKYAPARGSVARFTLP